MKVINNAKEWIKKNKVKIIAGGVLVGGAVLGYKMLPDGIEVNGFFRNKEKLSVDVIRGIDTTINITTYLPGINLGKIFIWGPEARASLNPDEAVRVANELYIAAGKSIPDVYEVGKF